MLRASSMVRTRARAFTQSPPLETYRYRDEIRAYGGGDGWAIYCALTGPPAFLLNLQARHITLRHFWCWSTQARGIAGGSLDYGGNPQAAQAIVEYITIEQGIAGCDGLAAGTTNHARAIEWTAEAASGAGVDHLVLRDVECQQGGIQLRNSYAATRPSKFGTVILEHVKAKATQLTNASGSTKRLSALMIGAPVDRLEMRHCSFDEAGITAEKAIEVSASNGPAGTVISAARLQRLPR